MTDREQLQDPDADWDRETTSSGSPILTRDELALEPMEFIRVLDTYGADPRIHAYIAERDRDREREAEAAGPEPDFSSRTADHASEVQDISQD